MEFTVDVATLRPEVNLLSAIADKKASVAVLATILIETTDNGIRLTGTDMESTLRTEIRCDVKTEGSVCVPAQKLCDIVRSLDNGKITIKSEPNNWVRLLCNSSKFRVQGLGKEHYPEVPEVDGDEVEMDAQAFAFLVSQTAFAASAENMRFIPSGANFEVKDGKVVMATTDSHRISISNAACEPEDADFTALLPKRALSEAVKMSDKRLTIKNSKNLVEFSSGNRILVARKHSGEFPEYRKVIPTEEQVSFSIDSEVLAKALRRVSVSSDDLSHSVTLQVTKDGIKLFSASNGEAEESIKVKTEGAEDSDMEIHLNWKFLSDFLAVTKRVRFSIETPTRPIKVEEGDAIYILVPLR